LLNGNLEDFHLECADDDQIVDVDTKHQLSGGFVPNVHTVLEAICIGLGASRTGPRHLAMKEL